MKIISCTKYLKTNSELLFITPFCLRRSQILKIVTGSKNTLSRAISQREEVVFSLQDLY